MAALKVMIGNGNVLDCDHLCANVCLSIQGQIFHVDHHVLPISGADIVLGVQWLKELGPIITDYSQLTMRFTRESQPIEFRADAPSDPSNVSAIS